MNYLQVKIVSVVLEEKIKHLKSCESINYFDTGYSKEDIKLLEEFIKEIQNITLTK